MKKNVILELMQHDFSIKDREGLQIPQREDNEVKPNLPFFDVLTRPIAFLPETS